MKTGKFYKITYPHNGFVHSFIGMYEGIYDGEYVDCTECAVCDKENHRKMYSNS